MTVSAAAGNIRERERWSLGSRVLDLTKPVLLGIVNVTPDSFSDGGVSFAADQAVARGLALLEQGADAIDIGGESTRPGAGAVTEAEEIRRILPVVEGLRAQAPNAVISVDTVKAAVASRALEAGADIVNDVSAFRLDPRMGKVCAEAGCGVILMHSRGDVSNMASYALAEYGDDPVAEIIAELSASARCAEEAGVARDRIALDPGFGFSKTSAHSIATLNQLERVCGLGFPVVAGLSRKRMIGELSGVDQPAARDSASVDAAVVALMNGATIFRVHNVQMHRGALDAAWVGRG